MPGILVATLDAQSIYEEGRESTMLETGLQRGSQGHHFGQRPEEDFLAMEWAVLGIPQLFELFCAVGEKGSQWPGSATAELCCVEKEH